MELTENGYMNLTMEGVAKRAGTSRTVLHRRWPNRAELTIATLKHYNDENPIEVPDLGNVRDEIRMLLRKPSKRSEAVFVVLIKSLLWRDAIQFL